MNPRHVLSAVLLVTVFGSLGVFAWRRLQTSPPATVDPTEAAADVLVTYFTTDVRCESCRTIEALARRAVVEGFPADLAAGRVAFRVVNTDQPQHEHFVERYAITNKTVVVSHQQQGREVEWTGRQDVWLHFDEPDAFFRYVREPITAYLAAK